MLSVLSAVTIGPPLDPPHNGRACSLSTALAVVQTVVQAAAYIASAPKSNRAGGAYFAALADVEEKGRLPVPLHLRPSAHRRLSREYGYGKGYLYPHDFEGADVDQQYLPDDLAGRVYYEPSEEGLEKQIGERLERLRSARRKRSKEG
jgi:putative ATPase